MYLNSNFFKATFLLLLIFPCFFSCKKNTDIVLKKGTVIHESTTVLLDTFLIELTKYQDPSAIVIEGEDILVDFQNALIRGASENVLPDQFHSIGIIVKGKNIEIKNLNVKGYKIGLLAEGVEGLKIYDSNFSHNYRPRLYSSYFGTVRYDFQNINLRKLTYALSEENTAPTMKEDDWLEYGGGIFLKNCKNVEIKNCTISQNQNGIICKSSNDNLFYNNSITYNSGIAIGMDESNNNKVMHNFLDWNIRGFTFNRNKKTFGSGGIFFTSSSKDNTVAFNSITHCGENTFGKNEFFENDFFPFESNPPNSSKAITPLPDGQNTSSKDHPRRGEKYILVNEWGPYNFEYPAIWLREINDDKYTFGIFGPEGNWKIVDGTGFIQTSRQSGSVPATVVATRSPEERYDRALELEFIGVAFTDQLNNYNKRGKTFKFGFKMPRRQ